MRLFNVKSPASRLPAPAFQEQTLITLRASAVAATFFFVLFQK